MHWAAVCVSPTDMHVCDEVERTFLYSLPLLIVQFLWRAAQCDTSLYCTVRRLGPIS